MNRKIIKQLKLFVLPLVVCCFSGPFAALAQQIKNVTGTVTDAETGETIPMVSVRLKRTGVVVTTDVNGKYGIKAGSTDQLSFSYVGYTERSLLVGEKTTLHIALKKTASNLSEVVVIGYGTVKKSDLTGAVGQVDMGDMAKAPVASFTDALAGRIAGVQVSAQDGQPGKG